MLFFSVLFCLFCFHCGDQKLSARSREAGRKSKRPHIAHLPSFLPSIRSASNSKCLQWEVTSKAFLACFTHSSIFGRVQNKKESWMECCLRQLGHYIVTCPLHVFQVFCCCPIPEPEKPDATCQARFRLWHGGEKLPCRTGSKTLRQLWRRSSNLFTLSSKEYAISWG